MSRIIVSEKTRAAMDRLLRPGESHEDLITRLMASARPATPPTRPAYTPPKKKVEEDEDDE